MKRLTDEQVAKALGWVCKYPHRLNNAGWRKPGDVGLHRLPFFTTSLDAIVAEVEARGLKWAVANLDQKRKPLAWVRKFHSNQAEARSLTPALALCAALLAYLKENPDAR